ncbi:MAG TPA: carbohydrate ABC transporter permease [Chloroflexota bacterium]|nr:carbohydrate ABC transporter permease [Chloroflexota bacterium]
MLRRLGLHLIAIGIGITLMLPFFWTISSSPKEAHEVRIIPIVWWPEVPRWENYPHVWSSRLFARFRFPGRDVLFSITMATMLLPGYVLLIPNYLLYWKLGWLNTYLPLTVPFWFGTAFFIFLFRQFFLTIPLDLDEAARIDGASYPRIFWSIVLPLSGPVYATAFIIEGIQQWNAFLRPLIILNRPESYPLQLGLRYFVVSPNDGTPKDHLLMAAAIISTIPVILIFFIGQRYFVRGVAMTGIKG